MCAEILECIENTGIKSTCPKCGFKSEWGSIRPHIVWFGEMPMFMDKIEDALQSCDMFVAIGTSGKVYPAAGFAKQANQSGAKTLLLNKEPVKNSDIFDTSFIGNATVNVPIWVDSLLS